MHINNSEQYEEIAAEFQFQQILLLKETLKKHGVDLKLAQEICGDFTFDLGMLIDQGEIKADQKSYQIQVCFNSDESELIVKNEEFEFHEYAFGNTSEAFDE